jgi:hypothetical protein
LQGANLDALSYKFLVRHCEALFFILVFHSIAMPVRNATVEFNAAKSLIDSTLCIDAFVSDLFSTSRKGTASSADRRPKQRCAPSRGEVAIACLRQRYMEDQRLLAIFDGRGDAISRCRRQARSNAGSRGSTQAAREPDLRSLILAYARLHSSRDGRATQRADRLGNGLESSSRVQRVGAGGVANKVARASSECALASVPTTMT